MRTTFWLPGWEKSVKVFLMSHQLCMDEFYAIKKPSTSCLNIFVLLVDAFVLDVSETKMQHILQTLLNIQLLFVGFLTLNEVMYVIYLSVAMQD